MQFESWLIGEIENPEEDIAAHEWLIQEELRQLKWADEEHKEKIRQDIMWRFKEIARLKRLLEQNKQKKAG